jgi:prepilin-type N-terminal cleavage/methylation domain-containing protein/prepilin-type processing-associated H-X9-DG protein
MRYVHRSRRGYTLVEVLVVIVIIGILLGLLLPAVQKAREAASRLRCANNLRQMGLAVHMSHDISGTLPSGGWGWNWVGDPSRGSGVSQPGGWVYQILPFVEQNAIYEMATSAADDVRMVAIPRALFNCPSRRTGGPYPAHSNFRNFGGHAVTRCARGDYAACAGDQVADEIYGGPLSLEQGDDPAYPWPSTARFTGVVFQRSTVRLVNITNGTSNTFLAGEKYLNPDHYANGRDGGDNENLYVGFDNDVSRETQYPPHQDRAGVTDPYVFGSAHPSGVNMVHCDGSVEHISFSVEPAVFRRAGNRN